MTAKSIFRSTGICLFLLAASCLWFAACASGGASSASTGSATESTAGESKQTASGAKAKTEERGLAVVELPQIAADIEVFPQMGHTYSLYNVAFSPDAKKIFSAGSGLMKVWDIATGREIRTFGDYAGSLSHFSVSPDGKRFLEGTSSYSFELWNAETGQSIRKFHGPDFVSSFCFSPDGKQILSGHKKTVILWNTETGQKIKTFSGDIPASCVAFSPDGKQFLWSTENNDGIIQLCGVDTGKEIRIFTGHTGYISSVCFSPDGKQALSGSKDKTIKLWDVQTGREIRTFTGHTDIVPSVCFSSDGKQALSGSWDKTIKLWDVDTGREIRTFKGHTKFVASVAFSPDGKQVLSGSWDKTVKLWDTESGQEIKTFSGYAPLVASTVLSPDGKQVVSWSGDGTINFWDMETGRKTRTFSGRHTGDTELEGQAELAISPDGRFIIFGYRNYRIFKIYDTVEGRELRTWRVSMPTGSRTTYDATTWMISLIPDGKQILWIDGNKDGTFHMWDVETGKETRTFSGHTDFVKSVCFSPDGKQALSSSRDGTIKLWDIATGREIKTFPGGFKVTSGGKLIDGGVQFASFSPDGKQILFAADSLFPEIRILDITTNASRKIGDAKVNLESLSFSPDGKMILAGSEGGEIYLWNVETGKLIRDIKTSGLRSACFSLDGKRVITGSGDGTVRLWDVSSGQELARFISFSGEDSQLASASRGLTVETETASSTIDGEWLAITPDGYYQASPRGDRYLNVRVNNTVSGIDSYRAVFYNPDVVQARLQGKPDPASKAKVTIQQAAGFIPPEVTIQSPANFSATNTATTNLSVNITSQGQPIKNIKIFVNGRSAGRNELAAVKGSNLKAERTSLTVTGNQKTVSLSMPLELDPGPNRIEVVAFNGYSENRRFVDVTRNAPAGEKPILPNLWIVAVGVNGYDNAGTNMQGLTNLNFAVADARGLVDALKAQEGKRYAKVNTLLIADGEAQAPTAANIRQGLKFLDQAGDRDVALLFLAGHGISAQQGKFFFLPKDAAFSGNRIVDANRAISGDEMTAALEGPGNRLLFIDACQSGGVDNNRMIRALQESNAFVFAASQGNESSYEDPGIGHGYFTHYIMNALKGAPAALAEGNVSVRSMSGFVSIEVPRQTNNRQNPKVHSLLFCDFPVAVIK